MDPESLLRLAQDLVEAPSPTGWEAPAVDVAERLLRAAGLEVTRQAVGSPARHNLFASSGSPRVVLSTHLDTVPGELPIRREADVLRGRGACDAKGAAAAMIGAASGLLAAGRTDFGLLFVVGEETTSDGAIAANALLSSGEIDWPCGFGLFGEPTGNRWVSGHPGVVVASLATRGRAGHSSQPGSGRSAISALVEWLHALLHARWPDEATSFQPGRIEGGTAANVIAEAARADVMIRSPLATPAVLEKLRELAPKDASIDLTCASEPIVFEPFPLGAGAQAEPAERAAFASDAPFLPALGRRFMLGPGSIASAHSSDEQVSGAELAEACVRYLSWAEACLAVPLEAEVR